MGWEGAAAATRKLGNHGVAQIKEDLLPYYEGITEISEPCAVDPTWDGGGGRQGRRERSQEEHASPARCGSRGSAGGGPSRAESLAGGCET
jgi:hypothetical protein